MRTQSTQTLSAEEHVNLILAGNAILTVKSKKTGVQLTYSISKPKKNGYDRNGVRFVTVRQDQLNGRGWGYVGFIIMNPRKGYPRLYDGKKPFLWGGPNKSAFTKGDYRVQGWDWLWRCLMMGDVPLNKVAIHHSSKCRKCGRKLIDVTSITLGIGPVCRKKLKTKEVN